MFQLSFIVLMSCLLNVLSNHLPGTAENLLQFHYFLRIKSLSKLLHIELSQANWSS